MALKDPTAWMDDLTVYLDDENIADTAATIEPTLVFGGSRTAAGVWIGLIGTLGGVLGGLTISPGIRQLLPFIGYVLFAAALLRGVNPLTKRFFGPAVAWHSMLALFWAALLAFFAVLGGGIQTRWIAYLVSVGSGAFVGLMYGSLTPGAIKREDTWLMTALPLAPLGAGVATYLLRHLPGAQETVVGAALAGALAGAILIVPTGFLLGRIWDEAHGLAHMGLLYLHNENFAAKAVAYFDRALAIQPNNARYYALRGVGWSRVGEHDRASADWDKATALSPANPEPHLHRGDALLRRGEIAGAIQAFETALNKSPNSAKAHRSIANAYDRNGDARRAIEHYDRAVAADDADARTYAERAAAYLRRGDHHRALADAEQAVDLDPGLALGRVIHGDVLAALGRPQDADESYRNALELDPEPSVREQALGGLETLGAVEVEDDDRE